MNKFKVGDRVAIYQYGRCTGEIIEIEDTTIYIRLGQETRSYHYKQCRRLKPKHKIKFLPPVVGGYYRIRMGDIVGPIIENIDGSDYEIEFFPFKCKTSPWIKFTKKGLSCLYCENEEWEESPGDLIERVIFVPYKEEK